MLLFKSLGNQSLSENPLRNFKSLAGSGAASPSYGVFFSIFSPKKGFDIKSQKPKFRGKEICADESHRELRFTAISCKCHHVAIMQSCACVCVHNTFYQETTATTITAVITFGGFQSSSAPCEPAESLSSAENYLSSPKITEIHVVCSRRRWKKRSIENPFPGHGKGGGRQVGEWLW